MISAELLNHLELGANLTSTSQDFQISSTLITLSSRPSKKELGVGPEEQYRAESCERGVTQTLDPGIVMGTIMLDHKFLVCSSTIYARASAKFSARS